MSLNAHTRFLGEESIGKLLLRFSIPAVIATTLNALYNIIDRMFVGQSLGQDALAAIQLCFAPTLLLLAFGMLIGQGSATLLSIKLGQRKAHDAEKILGQALCLFIILYVAIMGVVAFYLRDILSLFGAKKEILDLATSYYGILVSGVILEKISFGLNNLIRAEGRPLYSMSTMLIGIGVNIVLDWFFLMYLKLGIEWAAIATLIGQFCGALWVMRFYLCKKGSIALKFSNIRIFPSLFRSMLKMGSPIFMIQLLNAGVMSFVTVQIIKHGTANSLSIIGTIMPMDMIILLPTMGMNMGAQAILGFNWGAKNFDRVKRAFKYCLIASNSYTFLGGVIFFSIPNTLSRIFLENDQALLDEAAVAIRIMCSAFVVIGINITTSTYFQSTGRPAFSIFLSLLRQVIVMLPLVIFLPMYFGINGVFLSFPLSNYLTFAYSAIVIFYEFKRLDKLKHHKLKLDKEGNFVET